MADIAMCLNQTCPSKNICWRFTAPPDKYWQSYSPFQPDGDATKCREFIEARSLSQIKRMDAMTQEKKE